MVLAAAHGQAQCTDLTDNLYLGVAAGGAFQQDVSLHKSAFGNSGAMAFKPGMRGDLHLGYNLTSSFAVELQSGVVWNPVDTIAGNSISGNVYEVPLLANVIYRPFHGAFQPYIGLGCGGAVSTFSSAATPLLPQSYGATDCTFAYQAQVGVDYALSHSVRLGLAYEFLGTTAHDWSAGGSPLQTSGTMTHAVVASFIWEF